MSVEEIICQANFTRKVLTTVFTDLSVGELFSLADETIEKLINVIYWYDNNQQRLIKALVKRNSPSKKEVMKYDSARINPKISDY